MDESVESYCFTLVREAEISSVEIVVPREEKIMEDVLEQTEDKRR